MDSNTTRRNFLSKSATAAASGMLAPLAASAAKDTRAIGDVKPSLYTITYLGYWYRGQGLTMPQIIQRAKSYGFEGVEIEGKRPHGFPGDWPKSRCQQFKKQMQDAGLAITGVGADNDFSSGISEHREAQISNVRDLIRMTGDLDAKVLRVFLAWAGATKLPDGGGRYDLAQKIWQDTHNLFSEEQAWAWCREALIETSKYAGEHGVVLALQNHKPMIKNYQQVLQMIKEVNSPHLKACIDAPLMENKEPEYLRKALIDTGSLQVQTHFGGDFDRAAPGQPIRIKAIKSGWIQPYIYGGYQTQDIYTPFVQALFETGYRGYIGYELCHPLPVVNGKTVDLKYVDESTKLAGEYIKGVIAEAKKRALAARPT